MTLTCGSGCSVIKLAVHRLHEEASYRHSSKRIEKRSEKWAEEAFAQQYGSNEACYDNKHFHDGYVEGFKAHVVNGSTELPVFPPQRYRKARYATPAGKYHIDTWFLGYQNGIGAAVAGGIPRTGAPADAWLGRCGGTVPGGSRPAAAASGLRLTDRSAPDATGAARGRGDAAAATFTGAARSRINRRTGRGAVRTDGSRRATPVAGDRTDHRRVGARRVQPGHPGGFGRTCTSSGHAGCPVR